MGRSKMHQKATGKKFEYARMLRQESTKAEEKLWQYLRNRKLGVKFRRQHPIDRYIVDFFCFEKNLIIEVDGNIHLNPEVQKNDLEREKLLKSLGYRIVRFTNKEVDDDINEVKEVIRKELNG